ncbi:interferon lambda-1 [Ochotona princeps]|uniref:interferon lambda-1 n=1 Tax=Ochotona princeps TaxID=9978 RepID=UPI0027148A0E|nr:interferon lambda-1 [Ochotona princeps]
MAASTNLILLTLGVMALASARAGPLPTTQPSTTGKACHMDRFKSLSPRELQAFKRARDALEESLSLKNHKCTSRLFPRAWDLRQLQLWERPVALEAELALTRKVLEAAAAKEDSALSDVLDQPLRMLQHIHTQIRACLPARPAQPMAGPRPRGRLPHWLHRLQEASKKETPDCLEASVTFNLFRLLTWDLKCVASGALCV